MKLRTRVSKGILSEMSVLEALKCTAVLVFVGGLFSAPAYANPQGGSVVAGDASIAGQGTSQVTVTQTTDRAIINWNGFSIGLNERTDFLQPSASSIALNRVVGVNPSEILGTLTATGRLVLVNPNGILFGQGAMVDAAGLVATTHDVDDGQFMNGGPLRFNDGGKADASVVNQGTINIRDAGIAAFVAPHVRNSGIIQANLGTVELASASGFTLDLHGDRMISFEVGDKIAETLTTADGTPLKALVQNDGTIEAAGGRIYLTAEGAREVVNQSLNLSGIVRADSVTQEGGTIVLAGSGTVAVEKDAVISASGTSGGSVEVAARAFATDGEVRADGTTGSGGAVNIEAEFASLGGTISASGASGGSIDVETARNLSLAEEVLAMGSAGTGGTVSYRAGGDIVETSTGRTDVSGATDGGTITVDADGSYASSGSYAADGATGSGGRIDVSGYSVRALSASFSATGAGQGGLVRLGGAFQGGKTPDESQDYHDSFADRWGALPDLAEAERTLINDATVIDVSSSAGVGGTAIVWSADQTTFLGHIDARGAAGGGSVEISSANDLRQANLMNVQVGPGGHLLLDPKNIIIGDAETVSAWAYQGILGAGYAGSRNSNVALGAINGFGYSVALNAEGTLLAVGALRDYGSDNNSADSGAVYLFSFTDGNFTGGVLEAVVGKGYTGGKNIDVALDEGDQFGNAVALNASGDRLAVGAFLDDGYNDPAGFSNSGAVYLFSFSGEQFAGGTQEAVIGADYGALGGKNLSVSLDPGDRFGISLALNAVGDRLAVGSYQDGGFENSLELSGAVYLFSFTDSSFSGGQQEAIIGSGYGDLGGKNLSIELGESFLFGSGVALNAAGDILAVGASGDRGFDVDNPITGVGAVFLFTFSDQLFSGAEHVGTIGLDYTGGKNVSVELDQNDRFGISLALNAAGDRLAVGAYRDGGFENSLATSGAVYLFSFADGSFSDGALEAIVGSGYTGGKNIDVALEETARFGTSVALNAAGDRLVVGAVAGSQYLTGSAYLFTFTDTSFSGGALQGMIGHGYTGSRNVNVSLPGTGGSFGDAFGVSVTLNADATLMAVGSTTNDGPGGNNSNDYGAVYLFSFTDGNFSGGMLEAIVGSGYTGGKNIDVTLDQDDHFGRGVALNAAGDRLAVGVENDDGFGNAGTDNYGAVYLFSFAGDRFSDGSLSAIVGSGYEGGNNIDVSGLSAGDTFGRSVALNAAGDRLAVGASGDDGAGGATSNVGAVYLFSFAEDDGAFSGGELVAIVGHGYDDAARHDIDMSGEMGANAAFGVSVALNVVGDRLAVGATGMAAVYLFDFADGDGAFSGGQFAGDIFAADIGAPGGAIFGQSVALNAAGDRLAVGATGVGSARGAVYLFSFLDGNGDEVFPNATLRAVIGDGFDGNDGRDVDLPLDAGDQFGISVAMNAAGDRLVAGAWLDDGYGNSATNTGAVYLFAFADAAGPFSGGALQGIAGHGYYGRNVNVKLDASDGFGTAVALNGVGNLLAVGAPGDDGADGLTSDTGAVYLFGFADDGFFGGTLLAIVGKGYVGGNNVDVELDAGDAFGASVALNAAGDRMAVGATGDDGVDGLTGNAGAVYLFTFADDRFSGGALAAMIGAGYGGASDLDVATLDAGDAFGSGVALNAAGDRLAVGAQFDDGFGVGSTADNKGAVYLFSFTDTGFSGGVLEAVIGHGYGNYEGANGEKYFSVDLPDPDRFGVSVALNAAGDRLAVGANRDDGYNQTVNNSNEGAVYLFSFTDSDFSGAELEAVIGKEYGDHGGKYISVDLGQSNHFGSSVALNAAGDRLVVGAAGTASDVSIPGAVYIFDFTDNTFSGGELQAVLGIGYTGHGGRDADLTGLLANGDEFGIAVALNAAGDRLAVGARGDDGVSNGTSNAGAVYLFSAAIENGPYGPELPYEAFAHMTVTVSAAQLAYQLAQGTNLVLQASNDITVASAIEVLGSAGGDLTLQAGRSILVNASITTANGALTLIANDNLENGVIDIYRDAGNAVITMANGTMIDAGTGAVVIELRPGTGKTNTASGNISLRAITASSLSVTHTGPTVASDILIQNNITTTGAQTYLSPRDITVSTGITLTVSGHATLEMDAARRVQLAGTAKLQNTYSDDLTPFDAIVLKGNRRASQDTGSLSGIDLGSGAVISTASSGAGNISLSGRGGTTLGHGIAAVANVTIQSLGSGTVTLDGEAGNSTGNSSGIYLGTGTSVSSVDGDIDITALSVGAGGNYPAFYMLGGAAGGSTVQASGTGAITLNASRQNGLGEGIWIGLSGSKVQSASGNISITGTNDDAVYDAVRLGGSGQVLSTDGGDITITGIHQGGGTGRDFGMLTTSALGGAGTNDITINVDTAQASFFAGTIAGNGVLTIQPRSSGRTIGLGTGASGNLALSAAALGTIQDGFAEIVIGNSTTGAMAVGTGIGALGDNLRLVTSSTLVVGGALSVGTNRLTLDAGGAVSQTAALTAGQLLLLGSGTYGLSNAGNSIGTLAANTTNSIVLQHGGGSDLTVGSIASSYYGTINGIGATSVQLTTTDAAASILLSQGVTTTGAQTYTSARDIIISSDVSLTVSGQAEMAMEALAGQIMLGANAGLLNTFTGNTTPFDAITLRANLADEATANFHGINLASGSLIQTAAGGGGNILLEGRGGKGDGPARGIYMNNGIIQSLGHGTVTLTGYGASAGGNSQQGILTQGGGEISSVYGDISITGYGGVGGGNQSGVALTAGMQVLSTGTGVDAAAISITGYGGDEAGIFANMRGVFLEGDTTVIGSVDGNITITGFGGENTTGATSYGVHILHASVMASGTAGIVIDGTGGGQEGASDATGVFMGAGTALVQSASGNIGITGVGGVNATGSGTDGVRIASGAGVVSTESGSIIIDGTGGVLGSTSNRGLRITGGLVETRGSGDVWLIGVGGGTGNTNQGIYIDNAGQVLSGGDDETGTGTITLEGVGGGGATGANNQGIFFTGAGTLIESVLGNILIDGTGGLTNRGVHIQGGAEIVSIGTATITIDGRSDSAATSGVLLTGDGTAILSEIGDIFITGTGGTSGVALTDSVRVESTGVGAGAANITITGTGGTRASGSSYGVQMTGSSLVTSEFGDILIDGTGGAGTGSGNRGVLIAAGAVVESTGATADAATITIKGSGGGSGASNQNHGVDLDGGSRIESDAGLIVIEASRGPGASSLDFSNLVGDGAVASNTGRWIIYLSHPDNSTFGSLASGELPVWGQTVDTLPPDDADMPAEGNYYIFAHTPTLIVSTDFSDSKTYGDVYTLAAPELDTHYQLTFVDADLYGNVWVQETAANTGVSGAPVLASDGTVATANVANGPYEITIAAGDLANTAGYVFGGFTSTGQLTVTPKTLTVDEVLTQNKVYDTSQNAVLVFTTDDVINDDEVTFDFTALFADKNVGDGKTITVSDGIVTLAGADASNYTLSLDGGLLNDLTADITAATLTVGGSFTAENRVYDATTVAQIDGGLLTLGGILGDDTVSILGAGATGVFADKNVGDGKTVTLALDGSGVLTGADAGNYVLDTGGLDPVTADITAATLTITGTFMVDDKVYDGTTDAAISTNNLVLFGVHGDDDVDLSALAAFLDKDAGDGKLANLVGSSLDGLDAGNYALNFAGAPSATADIAQRTITVTAEAQTKVYGDADPTMGFEVGGLGLASGETVAGVFFGSLQRAGGENVGAYAIDQGTLAANDNYEITGFTGANLEITPATLTVTVNDATRPQGQANPAFSYGVTGYKFADGASVISGLVVETSATIDSPAQAYAIVAYGASAANYVFDYNPGTLTITPANTNSEVQKLNEQQLALLDQTKDLTGEIGIGATPFGSSSMVVVMIGGGAAVIPISERGGRSLDNVASALSEIETAAGENNVQVQAQIGGMGAIASCSGEMEVPSSVSDIVNVGDAEMVYCVSSTLPGVIQ